jgi:hypothetical protein
MAKKRGRKSTSRSKEEFGHLSKMEGRGYGGGQGSIKPMSIYGAGDLAAIQHQVRNPHIVGERMKARR